LTSIEDRLAYLGFALIEPSPALRPYVSEYWLMRREKSLLAYREEFMHALGGFGLVFNFGDAVTLNQQSIHEPVFLDGANSQSRRMGFSGSVSLLGIRFREASAYPFIGIPLAEVNNQTALMDVLGEDAVLPLYESLYHAPISEKIRQLEAWLLQRLTLGKSPDKLVWASLKRIQKGVASMDALAESMNISQRQLERLFHQQLGFSPKTYARLLRIDAARNALKTPQASLTDLGLSLGFYDQSHFIREFKTVIGMTPSAYVEHSLAVSEKPTA
jgi:AraC-like DNA-binding protein